MQRAGIRRILLWIVSAAIATLMLVSYGEAQSNHFYIHAVEASPYPERALPSAERLGEIAPGAGHLVHMPSHIYLRVGRYHDATLANEEAVKTDQSYIAQCRAQGFYPVAYYPHNQEIEVPYPQRDIHIRSSAIDCAPGTNQSHHGKMSNS